MNAQEVQTTSGAEEWRTPTLRAVLISGRIAGIRDHHGVPAGRAAWPAIISEEQHLQILATFQTKKASGRRAPRRHLLSGLLQCGKCGTRLYSSARGETRRYVCLSGPDHRGCGRLTIIAGPVEEWLAAAILMRLDTPAMNDALAGRVAADERQTALLVDLHAAQSRMEELAEMFAEGEISRVEWKAARAPLESRAITAQRQLD